jgi:hypothetical protein
MTFNTVPQLPRAEFFARMRAALPACAVESPDEALRAIDRYIGTQEAVDRLREGLEAFTLDPTSGHVGMVEIYDLCNARAAMTRPGFVVCNWHYDRATRALLVNLRTGGHELLAATLFNVYSGRESWLNKEDGAECYVREGMGWAMSTASRHRRPLRGRRVVLDAQERMVFRDVDFRDLS